LTHSIQSARPARGILKEVIEIEIMADNSGKFWGGDESDSESLSESSSSGEEEENAENLKSRNRWQDEDESSDSDSDDGRVVLSKKEKLQQQLMSTVNALTSLVGSNDWIGGMKRFQDLEKLIKKHFKKDVPNEYVVALVKIIDTEKSKDEVKSMSKTQAKAYQRMKQTIVKVSKNYQTKIKEYREDPSKFEPIKSDDDTDGDDTDDDDTDDDDDTSESDTDDESDNDVSDGGSVAFDTDDDTSSDEDDSELEGKWRWFIPIGKEEKPSKKNDQKVSKKPRNEKKKDIDVAAEEKMILVIDNVKVLNSKLDEILAQRGRRNISKQKILEQLIDLSSCANKFGDIHYLRVLSRVLTAYTDFTNGARKSMDLALLKRAIKTALTFLRVLSRHPSLVLTLTQAKSESELQVSGNLGIIVIGFETEWNKALKSLRSSQAEYLRVLGLESLLLDLASKTLSYFERVGDTKSSCSMMLLKIRHLYFKHCNISDIVLQDQEKRDCFGSHGAHPASAPSSSKNAQNLHPASMSKTFNVKRSPSHPISSIPEMCQYIYSRGDDKSKVHATVYEVYHHAIHDRFQEARDLLLMSRLQDNVMKIDIESQIFFNRSLAQLGLCAFRIGDMRKTLECLGELCSSSRTRELLGQSTSYNPKWQTKDREQDLIEKQRILPYHLHINHQLLEAVHFIAAMLMEVPNMAKDGLNDGVYLSRSFRRDLERYNRKVFDSPPENVKDIVMVAAQELSKGNWKKCSDLILDLKVWKTWSHCGAENVKVMLRKTIKEVSLQTYIISYNSHYNSMGVDQLCHMFDLDKNSVEDRRFVRRAVSRLLMRRDVDGSWDSKNETVNLLKAEPTHLQHLAIEFSKHAEKFVESNERTFESVTGTATSYTKKRGHQKDKKRRNGGGRRRGGGRGGRRGRGGGRSWGGGRRTWNNNNRSGKGQSHGGHSNRNSRGSRSIFMV